MEVDYKKAIVALKRAKKIWIIGDGGSAALADHFACDLLKNCRLPAISLCSNAAVLTAIANDYSFAEVFLMQLKILFNKGDLLVIFSTSGDSKNLIAASVVTKNTLLVVGGGHLEKECPGIPCFIDGKDQMDIEDRMLKFCHQIVRRINNWIEP